LSQEAGLQQVNDMELTRELEELAVLVADLMEEKVLDLIRRHLEAGISADEILSACQKGMRSVGMRHQEGRYFIAGLIWAGEIMREAVDLLRPVMTQRRTEEKKGRVLLGTIAGDIHDIGKNILRDLLECHGFTILDLGVDVPPADFLKAAKEFKPDLIGVSALITSSFPRLRELVELFDEAARQSQSARPVILIGGGQVDEQVFSVVGADYWAPDAMSAVRLCERLTTNG
jgi:dimethylamine corrinoid protein